VLVKTNKTIIDERLALQMFWLFALLRSGIGIGDAAFAAVSSAIISDLYAAEKRTKMLTIFFLSIPVGSGE
jgi:MFS family permease